LIVETIGIINEETVEAEVTVGDVAIVVIITTAISETDVLIVE
jgi:hypothetical protein